MNHVPRSPGGTPAHPLPALLLLALCLLAAGAQALMVPLDDAALATGADQIVRGQITGVRSAWNDDHTNIETTATVAVRARVKGVGPDTLALHALGGTADGITQWTEDQPAFVDGTEAYFFVTERPGRGATLLGGPQGMVPITDGRAAQGSAAKGGGTPVAEFDRYLGHLAAGEAIPPPTAMEPQTRAVPVAPVIASVVPDAGPAGTGTRVTITGSGFGTKASRESPADVAFLYRYAPGFYINTATSIWASGFPDYGDNQDEIVSWSDDRIVVTVPVGYTSDGYPGGASSGYVYVYTDAGTRSAFTPFTVTFSYGRAKWPGMARFWVNPGVEDPGVVFAIQNASGSWNAAIPSSSFLLAYQGTSSSTTFGRDGQSLVQFGPPSDFPSPAVLAQATWWSTAAGEILEADIEFNSAYAWTTGTASSADSTVNVEAIVLHELGHWLHLRDLYGWMPGYPSDVGKVMFGYNGDRFGNTNLKTLDEADAAGIRWIYPALPPLSMRSITPGAGARGMTVAIRSLAGEGFRDGAVVSLERPGAVVLADEVTVVSPTEITCRITLPADAPLGAWDVVLRNPGGMSAALPGGFTVVEGETYRFAGAWGAAGAGNGQFDYPFGIATDGAGNVYVADQGNRRVQKFTSSGTFVRAWGDERLFAEVAGVAVDAGGYVYATDYGWFRVSKFTPDGVLVAQWGTEGPGNGQFFGPSGIAIDGGGDVWVTDTTQKSIQRFTPNGTFLERWDFYGKEERFGLPVGIAVDGAGHVYVIDTRNNCVVKLGPDGVLLGKWGTAGSGEGQFSAPRAIAVDADGSVFVCDEGNHRVQKFTADGALLASWGSEGAGDGQFGIQRGIAVDGAGTVYVVDTGNNRVQTFARVLHLVVAVPGGTGVPTDTDADGLYDDVNGNGRADFADVVLFFNQISWIAENEPEAAFDFNGNAGIDFADVVWLFDHL